MTSPKGTSLLRSASLSFSRQSGLSSSASKKWLLGMNHMTQDWISLKNAIALCRKMTQAFDFQLLSGVIHARVTRAGLQHDQRRGVVRGLTLFQRCTLPPVPPSLGCPLNINRPTKQSQPEDFLISHGCSEALYATAKCWIYTEFITAKWMSKAFSTSFLKTPRVPRATWTASPQATGAKRLVGLGG